MLLTGLNSDKELTPMTNDARIEEPREGIPMETLERPIEIPAPVALGTCDRCGIAVAAFGAAVKDDQRLEFCGHHLARYSPSLIATGWEILDETHRINEKPMSGIVGEE